MDIYRSLCLKVREELSCRCKGVRYTLMKVGPNSNTNTFTETMVCVTTKGSSFGFWKLSRYGSDLNRAWVRVFFGENKVEF